MKYRPATRIGHRWRTGGRPIRPANAHSLMPAASPLTLPARAKLNVRLEVGRPAAGGLHAVRSAMVDLRLADAVTFAHSPLGFSVRCEGAEIPERENLAWRAAHELGAALPKLEVRIAKSIPLQAGLGGGSADAATTLRGLTLILGASGVTLDDDELVAAAARTGSDVTACLFPGVRGVGGTGDAVRAFGSPPAWGVLLLKPAIGVPTADAYRALDEMRARARQAPDLSDDRAIDTLCNALVDGDLTTAAALVRNDLERPVADAFPAVADALARVRALEPPASLLCGSGACVAAIYASIAQAREARAKLDVRADDWVCVTEFAHDD